MEIRLAKTPSPSRRGPLLAGWTRPASRGESRPKSWQPFQYGSWPANRTVAIGPSRMAAAHWRHGWSVLERTRFLWLRNLSRASTFISAWASAEPKISPGGPSLSSTRLRAAWTIVPSSLEATAPMAMFPVRSASQACRNASRQGSSSSAQTRAAVTGRSSGRESTTIVWRGG